MKVRVPITQSIPPPAPAITKRYLDSVWGEISDRYGIKSMADGKQWVINSLTGEPMERKNSLPYPDKTGRVMWLPKGYRISPLDNLRIYIWSNPTGKGTI